MSGPDGQEKVDHVQPGSGEALGVVGDVITVKVDGDASAGAYSCFDELTEPGGGPPPHYHRQAEIFQVLEGEVEFTQFVDGEPSATVAQPGSVVTIPPNAVHAFKNVGDTRSRVFFIGVPAGLEDFFRAVGEPVEDPDHPPVPEGPPDVARIVELGEQHGVHFVLPEG